MATKQSLELLHHFKYIHFCSLNPNLCYVPTPRGYKYDSILWDKKNEIIHKTLEYKFKETDSFWGPRVLKKLEKEYANVDIIDIGFENKASFLKHQSFLLDKFKAQGKPLIELWFNKSWSFFNSISI